MLDDSLHVATVLEAKAAYDEAMRRHDGDFGHDDVLVAAAQLRRARDAANSSSGQRSVDCLM
ncbi:hypothetical protein HJC99_01570 [Candidatus Saccharibacteria bacterium]|nr:hypothetical protein [Candidatus Saccharibacteria bacterium]